jgi:leucyl-tRNA synthetase
MMIFVNELTSAETRPVAAVRTLLVLLCPFAPHLAEELWNRLDSRFPGLNGLACEQQWPEWNDAYLVEDEVEIIIQINGKLRDKMTVRKDSEKAELERNALASPKVKEAIGDKTVRKLIVVPNKLVNIVAG